MSSKASNEIGILHPITGRRIVSDQDAQAVIDRMTEAGQVSCFLTVARSKSGALRIEGRPDLTPEEKELKKRLHDKAMAEHMSQATDQAGAPNAPK